MQEQFLNFFENPRSIYTISVFIAHLTDRTLIVFLRLVFGLVWNWVPLDVQILSFVLLATLHTAFQFAGRNCQSQWSEVFPAQEGGIG